MRVRSPAPPPASRTATRWRSKRSSSCRPFAGTRADRRASPARPARARARWWTRWRSPCAARGKTVGIIAVDPSSRVSGGAVLGDRIRMQRHHADPGVFIRSMATRGALGGLARATADLALLMDAAGRDYVVIETVGVGQDEIEIAGLAQVTVVVLVPGHGRRRAGPQGGHHGDRRRVRGQQSRPAGRASAWSASIARHAGPGARATGTAGRR